MATPTWPSSLPDALLVDGFSLVFPSSSVRTSMESGARFMRNRGVTTTPVSGSIAVNRTQLNTFDDFFVNQVLDGVLPFTWTDPMRGIPVAYRFANAPVYDPISPDVWNIRLELEILP